MSLPDKISSYRVNDLQMVLIKFLPSRRALIIVLTLWFKRAWLCLRLIGDSLIE